MYRREQEDCLEVVNPLGEVIGLAPRSKCHGDPSLIHRVSHILVFNSQGLILLQKRAMNKDIQPGKWDTSVGGHLDIGEGFEEAAYREMREELGIIQVPISYLYQYIWKTDIETEMVRTYHCIFDGTVSHNRAEIEQIRFWTIGDVLDRANDHFLTPNLKTEIHRYLYWTKMHRQTEERERT
ncbi:MAG: NUDIX hydrolase [bacterium]